MAMRRFIFFIVFLLGLGAITAHTQQQDSIPTNSVLYQQAIQAFQDQRFRLKVNSYEDHVRPIKPVQSMSHVVLWNGNIVISCYPGETLSVDQYYIDNGLMYRSNNVNQVITKALDFLNNPHEKIDLKTDDLFQVIIDNLYDLAKNGK